MALELIFVGLLTGYALGMVWGFAFALFPRTVLLGSMVALFVIALILMANPEQAAAEANLLYLIPEMIGAALGSFVGMMGGEVLRS